MKDYLNEGEAGSKYWKKQIDREKAEEVLEKQAMDDGFKKAQILLLDFHNKTSKIVNYEDRLESLKKMTSIELFFVTRKQLIAKRKRFNTLKESLFPLNGLCWCCRKDLSVHRHHILLLTNGGPEILSQNVVNLCIKCHSLIHPWLNNTFIFNSIESITQVLNDVKESKISRSKAEDDLKSIIINTLDRLTV